MGLWPRPLSSAGMIFGRGTASGMMTPLSSARMKAADLRGRNGGHIDRFDTAGGTPFIFLGHFRVRQRDPTVAAGTCQRALALRALQEIGSIVAVLHDISITAPALDRCPLPYPDAESLMLRLGKHCRGIAASGQPRRSAVIAADHYRGGLPATIARAPSGRWPASSARTMTALAE